MMEIIVPITILIILFILFTLCGWCCKRRHQGTVFGQSGTPIAVSNQPVNASPMIVPPYPMDNQHAMPQPMHPQLPVVMPGTGYHTGYPPVAASGFYCFPGSGSAQMGPGFQIAHPDGSYPPPPGTYHSQAAPPPSYNEAIAHPPITPSVINEGYVKQSPYNPNY